jgi:glutamine amidotransferase-like uncharacterized protein
MKIRNLIAFPFLALAISAQVGCAPSSSGSAADSASGEITPIPPDTAKIDPSNPASPVNNQNPPSVDPASYSTDVLLFNGAGISTSDWQTTEKIVKGMGLTYKLVNSAGLDAMSVDDMAKFGMFLVPGGHAGGITSGLKATTRVRVRQAVRDRGVAYLGICAGAFVAVESGAEGDQTTSYGFPVVEGAHMPVWWPNGNTSAIAAVVPVTFADGSKRQLVWYGGPATPEWSGGVIARYANGKPAMSQTTFHKGFVVISGPHPEAPQGWRNTAGSDSDGLDYDIMEKLVTATLTRKPLPAMN